MLLLCRLSCADIVLLRKLGLRDVPRDMVYPSEPIQNTTFHIWRFADCFGVGWGSPFGFTKEKNVAVNLLLSRALFR